MRLLVYSSPFLSFSLPKIQFFRRPLPLSLLLSTNIHLTERSHDDDDFHSPTPYIITIFPTLDLWSKLVNQLRETPPPAPTAAELFLLRSVVQRKGKSFNHGQSHSRKLTCRRHTRRLCRTSSRTQTVHGAKERAKGCRRVQVVVVGSKRRGTGRARRGRRWGREREAREKEGRFDHTTLSLEWMDGRTRTTAAALLGACQIGVL